MAGAEEEVFVQRSSNSRSTQTHNDAPSAQRRRFLGAALAGAEKPGYRVTGREP